MRIKKPTIKWASSGIFIVYGRLSLNNDSLIHCVYSCFFTVTGRIPSPIDWLKSSKTQQPDSMAADDRGKKTPCLQKLRQFVAH